MKLDDHLRAEGLTYTQFAQGVSRRLARKVTPRTIERYAKGQRTPQGEYMTAVLAEAGGKVDANSFYELSGSIAAG